MVVSWIGRRGGEEDVGAHDPNMRRSGGAVRRFTAMIANLPAKSAIVGRSSIAGWTARPPPSRCGLRASVRAGPAAAPDARREAGAIVSRCDAELALEHAAHPVVVVEAGLAGNLLERLAGGFQRQAGGVDPHHL